ncbi:PilZ domain-containing protein [Qipengyuania sp. ASV99]|uniref:PilZ domain-containing protein n=1 Tax=Qipengyuania sp. ASV99 TaxID=3399681 RepID=UPI003A4C81C8
MSISTRFAVDDGNAGKNTNNAGADSKLSTKHNLDVKGQERRAARRFLTAFRPGCIVIDNRIVLGLIRNMSMDGVMIEVDAPLKVGQRVAYFWDENRLVSASVAWSNGNRHGLENETEERVFDCRFSYRSVRVPCTMNAEFWVHGERHLVKMLNLSLGGMRIRAPQLQIGAPLTIGLCGVELYNASVRWSRQGEAGIRFAERLTLSQLTAILSHESVRFDPLVAR